MTKLTTRNTGLATLAEYEQCLDQIAELTVKRDKACLLYTSGLGRQDGHEVLHQGDRLARQVELILGADWQMCIRDRSLPGVRGLVAVVRTSKYLLHGVQVLAHLHVCLLYTSRCV